MKLSTSMQTLSLQTRVRSTIQAVLRGAIAKNILRLGLMHIIAGFTFITFGTASPATSMARSN